MKINISCQMWFDEKVYQKYLYSSFRIPNLIHLSLIISSPTLSQLSLIISERLSLEEYKDAEESIHDCWTVHMLLQQIMNPILKNY